METDICPQIRCYWVATVAEWEDTRADKLRLQKVTGQRREGRLHQSDLQIHSGRNGRGAMLGSTLNVEESGVPELQLEPNPLSTRLGAWDHTPLK